MDSMIDVTIAYPIKRADGRAPTFWDLLTGEAKEIVVRATEVEVPPHLLGRNFRTDREFRGELEAWVREVWQSKDRQITELTGKA
jgi:hypothetical protein